ncbi:MAG: hypothetical protein CMG75_06085 [Candidatus Marinimicrobia bacterium]|nr:hypothetical protein [Candidatus Neomarinimicrobiota bacterium]|tara:strand:- start:476 stop:1267 length:792 start_codon:yes stop_codon:yes gene_type:complete
MIFEKALILDNKKIANGIFEMVLSAKGIAALDPLPGQFINISLSDSWLHSLRRPMSIAGIDGPRLKIIYKLFGEGTFLLSKKKIGDLLDLLGPIGNYFQNPNGEHPILIGGGVGLAPILWLHKLFSDKGIIHHTIIGARSMSEHFLKHSPEDNLILSTDDGSIGKKGTVMPVLLDVCKNLEKPKLYACGPELMLKAVNDLAITQKINCELSVESYMGCATGICQGCVVEKSELNILGNEHSYHERYSLVCTNGPVYKAGEILF